jgi:hypothetical protein
VTKQEAARLVAGLVALYPHYEVEQATVSAYSRMLEDLDYAAAEAALREHVATNRMFPSVAEIRTLVAERSLGLPTPATAWELAEHASDVGGSKALPAPVRRALQYVGGNWAVRTTESPEILRSQFLKAYAEFRQEAIADVQIAPVAPREITPASIRALIDKAAPKELPGMRRDT